VGVVFNQITFPLRIFAQSAPKMTHCVVNIWSGFGQDLVRIWSGFFQFGQDFSNLVRNSCINRFGARIGICSQKLVKPCIY
jgi:hypothetical protein